jgi:hypothetical protein
MSDPYNIPDDETNIIMDGVMVKAATFNKLIEKLTSESSMFHDYFIGIHS